MRIVTEKTVRLLELLGHEEAPFGVHYSNAKPEGGFGPGPGEIFSRERERAGQINWKKAFGDDFSCIVRNIWLARKKRKAAWISHEECGCMGGGFYAGVYSPFLEMNVHYVSTGVPGHFEGERYLPSPESMRTFMSDAAPPPATGKYCIIKPLERFGSGETPLSVTFFARPETLNGLYSLACFAAGNHLAVVSPFGAGCGSIIAWPLVYQRRGEERAVLGGFDLSARKYLKPDELTFSVPLPLYRKMLDAMEDSALTRHNWGSVRKKARKSRRVWGEGEEKSEKI